MRAAEARVIAGGTSGRRLMERAGRAAADLAADMISPGRSVLVLCGPGNNGGDGFVAARVLRDRGIKVRVGLLGDSAALKGDAAGAAADWGDAVLTAHEAAAGIDAHMDGLVVDALFGIGLTRPLEGDAAAIVATIGKAGLPVLAIDVPSGIDADTGAVLGDAVRAATTITFAASKPGHWLMPGREHAGRLVVADIGVPVSPEPGLAVNGPGLWSDAFPRPGLAGHKYGRGHALVVSGDATHSGAARLAARAALRIGAGLVTVLAPEDALPIHAARLDAVMVRRCENADELASILADGRLNALVVGPGGGIGEPTAALAEAGMQAGRSLVIDADGLTSFAGQVPRLAAAVARSAGVVLTPHEGEYARLFRPLCGDFDSPSKLTRAAAAAQLTGAVTLIKGADTVIAAPDGRLVVNATGSPYLATAGSGDVLSGMIGGLMAQGMPAFEAACAGAWLHGLAGETFGPGLIAEDLPDMLPPVLAGLLAET